MTECPNCGETENVGDLYLPEYTLLCFVCEERFEVPPEEAE